MTALEKAYTTEYSYVAPSTYARELAGGLPGEESDSRNRNYKKKSRPAGEIELLPEREQKRLISLPVLMRSVLMLVIAGSLLVGTVWMSAKATQIKYSINRTNSEIRLLENEINTLNIKIQSSNGIEYVEEYAIDKLGMRYPKSSQCIYIEENAKLMDHFSQVIRQKAYAQ